MDLCPPSPHPLDTFSFVYINFGIILVVFIWCAAFLWIISKRFRHIIQYHHTISSYCSQPFGFGVRFSMAVTFLIGTNLSCILVEEYNERRRAGLEVDVSFWIRLACCASLPLVGMFYTEGSDERKHSPWRRGPSTIIPILSGDFQKTSYETITTESGTWQALSFYSRKNQITVKHTPGVEVDKNLLRLAFGAQIRNKRYVIGSEVGDPSIPISVSSWIHSISALFYVLAMAGINSWYCYQISERWVFPVGAILNDSILVSFFTIQGVILISEREDRESYKHNEYVYAASFILEFLLFIATTLLSIAVSIQRNPSIEWLKS